MNPQQPFIVGFYQSRQSNIFDYTYRVPDNNVLEEGEIFYIDGRQEQLTNELTGKPRHIQDYVLEPLFGTEIKYAPRISENQFKRLSTEEVQQHAAQQPRNKLNPRLEALLED